METKKKTFDAIEMSRRLRREVSAQIAGMTREEELAFFNSPLPEHPKELAAPRETAIVREDPPET